MVNVEEEIVVLCIFQQTDMEQAIPVDIERLDEPRLLDLDILYLLQTASST